MPGVSGISRLLGAFLLAIVMTPAFAADTAEVAWKGYLSDCDHFQQLVNNVQNGTLTAREAMLRIDSLMRPVFLHRQHLTQANLASADYARCENVIAQATEIWNNEHNVQDKEILQKALKAEAEHLESPEYRRARAMGFSDVGELGKLHEIAEDSDMDGEAYLKTLMITVDWGCGRHFRAVRYVKPYVIYNTHPDEGSCAIYREVAVLGGAMVERGDTIDRNAIFQYVGWKRLEGPGGFPVDIQVVKIRK